jgi:hypothetical protein
MIFFVLVCCAKKNLAALPGTTMKQIAIEAQNLVMVNRKFIHTALVALT